MQALWQDLRYGSANAVQNARRHVDGRDHAQRGNWRTAIFSALDKVLLRSLPVKEPKQLVLAVGESVNPKFRNNSFSYPNYLDYREQNEVFSGLLAYSPTTVKLGAGEQSDKFTLDLVSGNYFEVLGITAVQGRVITDEDNRAEDAHPVAVLSHICWQRRFGSQQGIVGQTVQLNGASYTIIGVAPAGFGGTRLVQQPEAWVPLVMRRQLLSARTSIFERKSAWLYLLGRLKPGVDLTQAQTSFDLTARRIWEANTTPSDRKLPFNEKRMLLVSPDSTSFLRGTFGPTLKAVVRRWCWNPHRALTVKSTLRPQLGGDAFAPTSDSGWQTNGDES